MNHSQIDSLETLSKEQLERFFPKLDVSGNANLKDYSWEDWHEGSLGAGDYFLADEIAVKLGLRPGMRVLELGSGRGYNACFIAKHFGIDIYPVDFNTNPTDVYNVAVQKRVQNRVNPLKSDARSLPFAEHFFDAVFSLNAFFYFGTDDTYVPYLSRFLKPEAGLCVISPCFSKEPDENTPDYFMFDTPEYIEYYSIHSPLWWKQHFQKYANVRLLSCAEHPLGREIWLDSIRWQLQTRPLPDIMRDAKMFLKDQEHFVTYFSLLAQLNA